MVGAAVVGCVLGAGPAAADRHSQLKRALQQAQCIPRNTAVIERREDMTVYDVTCLSRRPARVVVMCNARTCAADDPRHHDPDDEEL